MNFVRACGRWSVLIASVTVFMATEGAAIYCLYKLLGWIK